MYAILILSFSLKNRRCASEKYPRYTLAAGITAVKHICHQHCDAAPLPAYAARLAP
jgi:hypothetical protein